MNRLLAWITSLGSDALGRFALNILATAWFARLLDPRDFGLAALTVVYIGVLYTLVSALFEEALTQRERVRKSHFASALALSLSIAVLGIVGLNLVNGAAAFAPDDLRPLLALLAGYSLVLLADAPISIYTALHRRQRRFHAIARANFTGQLVGTSVGIGLAWIGVGVWSLLAVRFVGRYVTAVMLVCSSRVRVFPRWSMTHLRHVARFSAFHVAGVTVERMTDALIQTLVTMNFGLSGNGYLNMAIRVIEPLRGAVGAIGHNIAMSFFVRTQSSPQRLHQQIRSTLTGASLFLLPAYLGLAAVSSSLIPALAGPGWEGSIPLLACMALAAALTMPTDFLHSAISARGRADVGFTAAMLELTLIGGVINLFSGIGLLVVGIARLAGSAGDAVFAAIASRRVTRFPLIELFDAIWPAALHATWMAGLVFVAGYLLGGTAPPLLVLGAQILAGMIVYGLSLWRFHRQRLEGLRELFSARPRPE